MNLIIDPDNHNFLQLFRYFDGKEWHERWERKGEASRAVSANHFEEIEPIRQQVLDGKLSPLGYHIEKDLFSLRILSAYTGIPKRHIKKHLKPEKFNQLDDETLKKYAETFGISVEELKTV